MKKSRKISVITAAALTAAGIVISFAAMLAADFDFGKFSTDSLEERIYENLGEFHNIEIESNEFDLHILPSTDGKCRVVSWESEKSENSVSAENDTLRIKSINNRKWYEHINITIGETRTVTVYLPKAHTARSQPKPQAEMSACHPASYLKAQALFQQAATSLPKMQKQIFCTCRAQAET